VERIAPTRLSASILAALAKHIQQTGLTEGDRLPPEREIALQLGVSRPLVREALQHWRALGFVETINGRGSFLRADIVPNHQHVVFILPQEQESLLHALEIRRALEPEAAALAAERATDEQVRALGALLDTVEDAYRRVGDAPDEDWAFHQALYEASGNPLFSQLIHAIHSIFHRFWENPVQRPGFAQRGIIHHRTLVERVRARDPEGARAAALSILQVLEEDLLSHDQGRVWRGASDAEGGMAHGVNRSGRVSDCRLSPTLDEGEA
jgi:DNA-binding FadR family transcriptional regulator